MRLRVVACFLAVVLAGVALATCRRKPAVEPPKPEPPKVTESRRPPRPPRAEPPTPDEFSQFMAKESRVHRRKRPQRTLRPEQESTIEETKERWAAANSDDRMDLLDKVSGIYHAKVLDIVANALGDDEVEVRRLAIEMIQDYDTPLVIPLVKKALSDSDADTRAMALGALYYADDPEVQTLLVRGLSDADEDVREEALEAAAEQPDDVKYAVYAKGLEVAPSDAKLRVISRLEVEQTHGAVDILLAGLKDKDPAVVEDTQMALDFLLFRIFDSYEQAKTWWDANKHKLDDELFEKDM